MTAGTTGQTITVEVACAICEPQRLVQVELPVGATIADALEASGMKEEFSEDSDRKVGIYSRQLSPGDPVNDGDRVEIYGPLAGDTYQRRRERKR